ncbi:MAG: hypothetical protein NTV94_15250 [Planctomycetota bacterium]|nr:hypothetical protein [Planctomycetota bacterium]
MFWSSLAIACLTLCLLIISLWRNISIAGGSNWQVQIYRGGVAITIGLEGASYWDYTTLEVQSKEAIFWLPRQYFFSQAAQGAVILPLPWLVAGTSLLAAGAALRTRRHPGKCPGCRYDITSTAHRGICPECGTTLR